MLTEKDIRPVPKYILKKIEREDAHRFPFPEKQVRFYAYLAIWKKTRQSDRCGQACAKGAPVREGTAIIVHGKRYEQAK